MTRPTRARLVMATSVLAISVAACSGGSGAVQGNGDPSNEATSQSRQGGTLDVYSAEPAYLFPAMTGEFNGSNVLTALFSPLINYDPETGEPYPVAAAELPTSENGDNQNWTIRIKDGWTFHNGEPVTAQSYVDSWNWAVYGPNAATTGYYYGPGMADIAGYADLQSGADPDGEGPQAAPEPVSKAMSGLAVVDDTTFTVELAAPFSQFPMMLGYNAFYPVPAECLADWLACNETPIGNGPFQIEGTWRHDEGITAVRYDNYAGPARPNIDKIEFRIYSDNETAYLELDDGQLDYMGGIPIERLADASERFGDRFIDQESAAFTYLGVPLASEQFGGPEDYGGEGKRNLRHALSMAINRQELIDNVLNGAFVPADSLVSPVVLGYREGACGEWCEYDLEAARALYEQSDKIDGPITLWYSEGASNEVWLTAVGNYWNSAFGIEYDLEARVWADYLQSLSDRTVDGLFALGWYMDYPSAQNFIAPIYQTGAGWNLFDYSSAEADQLMVEGNSAPTVEDSLRYYNEAEDVILDDMPVIPVVFGRSIGGYNENVANVSVDKFGYLDFTKVTVTD